MKLDKETRERLYKSKGRPITIIWPEDAPLPSWGHRYPIYGDAGDYAFTVRLEGSKRHRWETEATVRVDADPTRVMRGLAAVRNGAGDYETEPEQVDRGYEQILAQEGRLKTVMAGATKRHMERVVAQEQRLHDARTKGQDKSARTLERVRRAA